MDRESFRCLHETHERPGERHGTDLVARRDRNLFLQSADGSAEARNILSGPQAVAPTDWCTNGVLLYRRFDTNFDIWALNMEGEREGETYAVVEGDDNQIAGQLSAGCDWIAYLSNQTGRQEVWVQRFSGGSPKQMTFDGATGVRWRQDGSELFYRGLDGRLWALPIQVASNGQDIGLLGEPIPVFEVQTARAEVLGNGTQFVVSPDARSFLVSLPSGDEEPSVLMLLQNWNPDVE